MVWDVSMTPFNFLPTELPFSAQPAQQKSPAHVNVFQRAIIQSDQNNSQKSSLTGEAG
jgi:hypothetical protein